MNDEKTPAPAFLVRFGVPESACRRSVFGVELEVAAPVLSGAGQEVLLPASPSTSSGEEGGFAWSEADGLIAAGAAVEVENRRDLEEVTHALYTRLLSLFGGDWRFYRVWNYVPEINAVVDGLENYRAFNRGRWSAFAEAFAQPEEQTLPAASAVGVQGNRLVVAFVGGLEEPRYFENPGQVPAYRYPDTYGPRPPSFCRGATVGTTAALAYLSGTASIRGHATVGRGSLEKQLEVTCENIAAMKEEMGITPAFRQEMKCYLRHAGDIASTERFLDAAPAMEGCGAIQFLHSDICREDLLVEIEGVFSRRTDD